MPKALKIREKLKNISEIKVFAVDDNNNIISKFKVKKGAKTPVAKCFYDVSMRVIDLVEERKENKANK